MMRSSLRFQESQTYSNGTFFSLGKSSHSVSEMATEHTVKLGGELTNMNCPPGVMRGRVSAFLGGKTFMVEIQDGYKQNTVLVVDRGLKSEDLTIAVANRYVDVSRIVFWIRISEECRGELVLVRNSVTLSEDDDVYGTQLLMGDVEFQTWHESASRYIKNVSRSINADPEHVYHKNDIFILSWKGNMTFSVIYCEDGRQKDVEISGIYSSAHLSSTVASFVFKKLLFRTAKIVEHAYISEHKILGSIYIDRIDISQYFIENSLAKPNMFTSRNDLNNTLAVGTMLTGKVIKVTNNHSILVKSDLIYELQLNGVSFHPISTESGLSSWEQLRRMLIGQVITCYIDEIVDKEIYASILLEEVDIALKLLEEGYAMFTATSLMQPPRSLSQMRSVPFVPLPEGNKRKRPDVSTSISGETNVLEGVVVAIYGIDSIVVAFDSYSQETIVSCDHLQLPYRKVYQDFLIENLLQREVIVEIKSCLKRCITGTISLKNGPSLDALIKSAGFVSGGSICCDKPVLCTVKDVENGFYVSLELDESVIQENMLYYKIERNGRQWRAIKDGPDSIYLIDEGRSVPYDGELGAQMQNFDSPFGIKARLAYICPFPEDTDTSDSVEYLKTLLMGRKKLYAHFINSSPTPAVLLSLEKDVTSMCVQFVALKDGACAFRSEKLLSDTFLPFEDALLEAERLGIIGQKGRWVVGR